MWAWQIADASFHSAEIRRILQAEFRQHQGSNLSGEAGIRFFSI
jgi:hypothetical protein